MTDNDAGVATSQPDERVAQRLYLAARHHVRAAQMRAGSQDHYDRIDAAYHAGSAVELIAKAALARLDPRVLVKGLAAQHALLDALVEHHKRPGFVPRTAKLDAQTIDASVAIELAHRLVPECRPHRGAADKARVVRNGAVHMAVLDDAGLDDVWGEGLREESERVMAARRERIGRVARIKVIVARDRYRDLVGELTDATREALVADLARRSVATSDEQWQVECPACELPYAWLMWDAAYEPLLDGDDWTYEGGLALTGLRCPVCTLDLVPDEVGALGIDTEPVYEPEFGPDEDR